MEAFKTRLEGRSPLGRTADAAVGLADWLKGRPLLTPLGIPHNRHMGKTQAPGTVPRPARRGRVRVSRKRRDDTPF